MTIAETDHSEPSALPVEDKHKRPPGPTASLVRSKAFQSSLTFFVFMAVFVVFSVWLGGTFLNTDARLLNIHQNVPLLLLGLAAMVTLLAGLFDLSIASMASLCTFLTIGLRTQQELPFWLVLVICLVIGGLGGLLNGLLVEKLHVNAFIATLGTGGLFIGASRIYADGAAITPTADSLPIPTWFGSLGAFTERPPQWIPAVLCIVIAVLALAALWRARPARFTPRAWGAVSIAAVVVTVAILLALGLRSWVESVSWLVLFLLVVGTVMWVLVDHTVYGRNLKATGSNPLAAQLAGIRTTGVVIRAFVIGGVLAALAGIVLAATQGSASPDIAGPYLLPAFAAAFLSTVVFSTGRFTVWGTLAGGIFVVWVGQGLISGGLPPTWSSVVNGGVLLLAVALSTVLRRSGR
ncbi:sugar ABC transporter permease [soil metagenome]